MGYLFPQRHSFIDFIILINLIDIGWYLKAGLLFTSFIASKVGSILKNLLPNPSSFTPHSEGPANLGQVVEAKKKIYSVSQQDQEWWTSIPEDHLRTGFKFLLW